MCQSLCRVNQKSGTKDPMVGLYGGTLGSGIYPSNFDVRYTAQKTQSWTEF